jgi:hypothetical protein
VRPVEWCVWRQGAAGGVSARASASSVRVMCTTQTPSSPAPRSTAHAGTACRPARLPLDRATHEPPPLCPPPPPRGPLRSTHLAVGSRHLITHDCFCHDEASRARGALRARQRAMRGTHGDGGGAGSKLAALHRHAAAHQHCPGCACCAPPPSASTPLSLQPCSRPLRPVTIACVKPNTHLVCVEIRGAAGGRGADAAGWSAAAAPRVSGCGDAASTAGRCRFARWCCCWQGAMAVYIVDHHPSSGCRRPRTGAAACSCATHARCQHECCCCCTIGAPGVGRDTDLMAGCGIQRAQQTLYTRTACHI